MNTFTKKNDRWVAKMQRESAPGQPAILTLRNGSTKNVTLGAFIEADEYGYYYQIAQAPAAQAQPVGSLTRIVAMLTKAAQHLKYPAIVLDGFRVNIAGAQAKEPGSLTVTSIEKDADNRRTWFGRVTKAGVFQPGRDAPDDLGDKLRAFAADPERVAGDYGRLHGACCFCRKALSDERSTAVGYGPICADHFGLPWGDTDTEYHTAQERAAHRMEAS
jgi:hypothetical protein